MNDKEGFPSMIFNGHNFVIRTDRAVKCLSKRNDVIFVTRDEWNDISERMDEIYRLYIKHDHPQT